jgi:hypothetical protein
MLIEEDWEVNFCSFKKRAHKPARERFDDDEMPSRCHFRSWLVRTSLMVPLPSLPHPDDPRRCVNMANK